MKSCYLSGVIVLLITLAGDGFGDKAQGCCNACCQKDCRTSPWTQVICWGEQKESLSGGERERERERVSLCVCVSQSWVHFESIVIYFQCVLCENKRVHMIDIQAVHH